ncbi:unnamed protein product [Onchocerca ochengi]|uniref:Microcephalin n=1 Tax=Onchocerca ochengi TaxID=42157 RepID=A0A182E0Z2_ONCOC|nr:unnamed protein product [Onchocerca ochengi]
MEAQLEAFESSSVLQDNQMENAKCLNVEKSKILEGVRAFVDVRLERTLVLRRMLRDLGAIVNLRFSRNITHLIFWNGRQKTLDKAHQLETKVSIISPHWVFKCFMNLIRADEAPFLLYGVKDLAVPMRLMAMGRVGTVKMSCRDSASNQNDGSPNQSQIIHAIETLSDQLASRLTSPANNENIDVVEIISPIVDRVRKRLNELSYCRVNGKQRRHTISRISMFHGESEHQFTTPTTENSTSAEVVNLVEITQSEPVKRRGRPAMNSEQLADYTPTRFHRYLQRRYRSIKAEHAAQLNTEKMVFLYKKMMNQNFSGIISDGQKLSTRKIISKARPVVVRTRSSVLNELQNVPSSNEFVKKKKVAKKRVKTGNIVLSGINKIERETVFAITKKLGVLKIASAVDDRTRYVVSDQEGMRTVNVMRALVKGIPIVTIEWAYRSLEIGGWLKGTDFFVPRWKTVHKAWLSGHMAHLFSALGPFYVSSKCEPEANHLLYLIKSCHGKTTESLNRAVIFVSPQSEWRTIMQLRKDTDKRATYITEKSLLDQMVKMWNDDSRLILIEEVRKRREVWEYKKERYATSERKKELFAEVAGALNASGLVTAGLYTEEDVRTQWKNLKDTFKRKLKRRQAEASAGYEDVEPTWRFWSKMQFVKNNFGPDRNRSSALNSTILVENTPNTLEKLISSLVEKQMSDDSNNSIDGQLLNVTELPSVASTSLPIPSANSNSNSSCNKNTLNNINTFIPDIQVTSTATPTIEMHIAQFVPPNINYLEGIASHSPLSQHLGFDSNKLRSPSPINPEIHPCASALADLQKKAMKRKASEAGNEDLQNIQEPDDECAWFGRSVSSALRRLCLTSPLSALTLKKQISDLIYEAEIKQLVRHRRTEQS